MPQIPISKIEVDEAILPRVVSDHVVKQYALALECGNDEFPPILVGKAGDGYVLIDGAHRLRAFKECHRVTINAFVSRRAQAEWFEEAVSANARNGLPLTPDERIAAAQKLKAMGYNFDKISRIVAIPAQAIKAISEQVERVNTGQATYPNGEPVEGHRPEFNSGPCDGPSILPANDRNLAGALSFVIEQFETNQIPDPLLNMGVRLFKAVSDWISKNRRAA